MVPDFRIRTSEYWIRTWIRVNTVLWLTVFVAYRRFSSLEVMPAAYLYIPERHKKFLKILTSFDTNANLNRVKFEAITTVFLVFTETWDLLYLKLPILKDDTTMRTICTFKHYMRTLHSRPYERTVRRFRLYIFFTFSICK